MCPFFRKLTNVSFLCGTIEVNGRYSDKKEVRIMEKQMETWVEQYSLPLLRWCLGKTGSRSQAEDLAQEVWLQFFSAVRKEQAPIRQPEHLLFRIARFVWCKHLRKKQQLQPLVESLMAPDFTDSWADETEAEQQLRWLHEKITRLSHLHREIMILYYVDQLSQRQIAEKLHLPQSTVRWYLFDTRRKLREEKKSMNQTNYAYRPQRLSMGINGTCGPDLATNRITQNLLMQNILIACYQEAKKPQEIADRLGVACAYIEHELEWLVQQEFVAEENGKYATSFLIRTTRQEDEVSRLFEKHKPHLSDKIVQYLKEKESEIRAIGFVGCDRPMEKLLWLLIYHFTQQYLQFEMPPRPIRADGGQYWPLGHVRSDPAEGLRAGWAYNGSMHIDDFFWFGLYNFGRSEIENLMDAYTPYWHGLREFLKKLIRNHFDEACIHENEKEKLATLIEKGFVLKEDGQLRPNFVIFTPAQYTLLRESIFKPLKQLLQPALDALTRDMEALCRSALPRHLNHLTPLLLSQSLSSLGFETEYLAFRDGHLYQPQDPHDGEFLTLAYLYQ